MKTTSEPTKHTPGPWEVGSKLNDGNLGVLDAGPETQCFVAFVPPNHIRGTQHQEANARLISAAPELLQACKDAANWLARSVRKDDQECAEDLRAAITKAEGEA
jgi:hypothetical protein